jgi:Bacterial PH domain
LSMEHDAEPIRGLPGALPAGEHIIWQGTPEWRRLARDAFKTRWVMGYFAALLLWAIVEGTLTGLAMTAFMGVLGVGGLYALAWLATRSTVYTLTNRRIVLRFGIALTKCINLPLAAIAEAGIKVNSDGTGDIPLTLSQPHRLGYAQFWPHVRPWKIGRPEPMLRSIAGVESVAGQLAGALAANQPSGARMQASTLNRNEGALAAA